MGAMDKMIQSSIILFRYYCSSSAWHTLVSTIIGVAKPPLSKDFILYLSCTLGCAVSTVALESEPNFGIKLVPKYFRPVPAFTVLLTSAAFGSVCHNQGTGNAGYHRGNPYQGTLLAATTRVLLGSTRLHRA